MYYLKTIDFDGIFTLPTNTPQFQTKMETMIEQREKENIKYILGNDLGNAFINDLDVNGDPQATRFVSIDAKLRYSVLRYTFTEVVTFLRTLVTPLGAVNPIQSETPQYPAIALAQITDEAAENGIQLRNEILKNSSQYPEYCPACVSTLRKMIF